MGVRGDIRQQTSSYSEEQTRAVITNIGIDVAGETFNDFVALCPFHGNRYTPSLSISKLKGTFLCFNPSCYKAGSLVDLVMEKTDKTFHEAMRMILSHGSQSTTDTLTKLQQAMEEKVEFVPFPQDVLDRCYESMNDDARKYMYGRGFTDETLENFKVGFSAEKWKDGRKIHGDMVIVPMHSPDGIPVGLFGRGIGEDKEFKNSRKLPTSKTYWNLHRAKRASSTAIVVESCFDAMRVHQASYPGVVATMGGTLNPIKLGLLDRHFDRIIIMTDFDELQVPKEGARCPTCRGEECVGHNPGRDLGQRLAKALGHKDIWWAATEYNVVYPHGAKDAGDLTDKEIDTMIQNAVPNVEYQTWTTY